MISAQLKVDVQKWMAEWLGGSDYDGEIEHQRRSRFPDVPRASFYRWWRMAKVHAAKVGVIETQRAAQILAVEGNRQERQLELAARKAEIKLDAKRLSAALPKLITPDSILPVPRTSTIELIGICINNAKTVMAECMNADGLIQDPKTFLQASNHLLACVVTQAKVTELLFDAQRIEKLQQTMMEEITRCDPEVARSIIGRIRKLLEQWGG